MPHPGATIVIVDSDEERGRALSPIMAFLDYQCLAVVEPADLPGLVAGNHNVAMVLVRDKPDYDLVTATVAALRDAVLSLPCFVVEEAGLSYAELPLELAASVVGRMPPEIRYADMRWALHECGLFREKGVSDEDGSSYMARTLIGAGREISYVRRLIRQVAAADASVLILGESGTGKEVVARNIHHYSTRSDHAFVPVNCGAIPADLLESELFGHEKGAFTGAFSARQGRFELAEGGTLFLDEIGDMPLNMQVKLLRVLQERAFERVGSNTSIQANVRIIAATHQNLEQLVEEGRFRADLYYRINVFPLAVPPLRQRVEDIRPLVQGLVERMEKEKRGSVDISTQAYSALSKYDWPGNVRELANLIERLAILYPHKRIEIGDLPEKFCRNLDWVAELSDDALPDPGADAPPATPTLPAQGMDLKVYMAETESALMTRALEQSDWVVARAAKLLNLQRTTLVEKMRKYEIIRPESVSEI